MMEEREFSRLVEASKVGQIITIEATEAECAAIAKRLDLAALKSLKATLALKKGRGDIVHVRGHFEAEVVQTCIITLEPLTVSLKQDVQESFSDSATSLPLDREPTEDDLNSPEPMENGKIDLGELVVQDLSMSIDPYPRKEGIDFKGYEI